MDARRKTHEDHNQTDIYPIDLNILNCLRDSKAFCDVTIVIENQEFSAHKVILTSSSPYFYTMFLSDFGERAKSRVELKGLDVNSFEVIVKFIYTGQLEISTENAQSLIMAASLLQMDSLMGRCADFLEEQLDVDNCLEIKDFANYQVGCEKLRLAAERFAGKAFDKFFGSPDAGSGGTPTKEFLELTLDDLSNWISQDNLYVHEDQVLEGIMAWIDHDRELREGCFKMLMDHVRTSYVSDAGRKLKKFDQMGSNKLSRSGHDEMLLARIATLDQKMRPSLFSFDFKDEKWNQVIDPDQIMPEGLTGNLCSLSDRIYILPDNQNRPLKSIGLKTKTFNHSRRPITSIHFSETSAIEVNNVVYVFDDSASFKVEIDDDGKGILDSRWLLISPMGDGVKVDFGLGELNKKIYVSGGNGEGRNFDTVQMFNIDEGNWSYVASMTLARSGHGVVSLGGYLYAIGGANYDGGHTIFKSVEKYDPKTDTWTTVADMNQARFGHGAASHDGKIYVFGGYSEELNFVHGILDSIEVYDPAFDKWTLLDSKMPGVLSGGGGGAFTTIHKYNL